MKAKMESDTSVQDEAARAGWLYYVGHLTQDQIAAEMGVSRQRAQRLVSRAMAGGLIHVRLQHPIGHCLELEQGLSKQFGLRRCRVAPSIARASDPTPSIAPVAAAEIERALRSVDPLIIALGTGRTMRASVDELTPMICDHHRLVSLNGTIGPNGAASSYDVIMRIADLVQAPHYPMPVPVICDSVEERAAFYKLAPIRKVAELAQSADAVFVGLGQMSETAPLFLDGYLSHAEMDDLRDRGAAGEIAGWIYDSEGQYMAGGVGDRNGGVRIEPNARMGVTGIAAGPLKVPALRAALKGRLINGLVTDEDTAKALIV